MLDRKVYLNIEAQGFVTEVRRTEEENVQGSQPAENEEDEGEKTQKAQVHMVRMTYMKLSADK